jgi:hypothetical protein
MNALAEKQALELAARWSAILIDKDWRERLDLLHQIHEQLQDDLNDLELYCQVSPLLIKSIIDALHGGPVTSTEQAHVYANSGDEAHRAAAGEWLAKHSATKKAAHE